MAKAAPPPADLILRGGVIYTVDAARSWATAVAVSGRSIVYAGDEKGVARFAGPRTRVIDLKGKFVLPGFHDSHTHPVTSGIDLGECFLNELTTREQILEAIRQFAEKNPQKPWIRGGGWQLPVFEAANPHKSLLDKIVSGRPVFLVAADGHSAWVNSRALALAGITADTPDPKNGRIERDPKTGEPTGTLRESAAGLVAKHVPAYTAEDHLRGLVRGLQMANRFGITSLQEASADDEQVLQAYAELDRRGKLSARVVAAIWVDLDKGVAEIARLKHLRKKYQTAHLRADSVKIFLDGVIEAHTAALLDPYTDKAGDSGKARIEPAALGELVTALDREGFQIHVHAIGDRAVRMALDAFEHARAVNGSRDSRHHIAHLELISPQDLPRFRRLGVVANFQPLWAYPDTYIKQLTEPVLGPERSARLYPIGSVARTGATVAAGSDWSVSSMNPLEAMQVAVTRRGTGDGPGPAWIAEELVDLPAIIASYTIGGAYVNFQEKKTGSIEAGKAADLIILDRNIFDVAAHEIHQAKVLATVFEGKIIYRAPAF
jgi:predicted amidohydrolase YtcJ